MTDDDYIDIFRTTRRQVVAFGLGAFDERVITNLRGSDGPFWDLLYYLRHLRDEIQLGSDIQYRETLVRLRQYVRTESGGAVEGVRIQFSPEDIERYGMREMGFSSSKELGEIAQDIDVLIEALQREHRRGGERGRER